MAIRFDSAASSREVVFEPRKALDAIRFHIREIRHVRDFVGTERMCQRLVDAQICLRIPARQWRNWKNIRRLLWLLAKSRITYRVNAQNVAIFVPQDGREAED